MLAEFEILSPANLDEAPPSKPVTLVPFKELCQIRSKLLQLSDHRHRHHRHRPLLPRQYRTGPANPDRLPLFRC